MKRPSDSIPADSRQRVLDAATEVFMEEGYRASIDRVAAKAGVAKQTVYNHFPSKDVLFGEVSRRCSASILVSLDGNEDDVRESLLRFGAVFRERMLSDDGIAAYRALIAEAARFPALARAFYANAPQQTAQRLAGFIARAMERGVLRRDDPRFAADMLLGMLATVERTARLCGEPLPPPAMEAQRVARTIDCFLLAFASERKEP